MRSHGLYIPAIAPAEQRNIKCPKQWVGGPGIQELELGLSGPVGVGGVAGLTLSHLVSLQVN